MADLLTVFAAAAVVFAAGALWYMILAEPWMSDVGMPRGPDGKPAGGQRPVVFVYSFVLLLIVSGMMRHIFASAGIATAGAGLVSGLGIGLFLITPWIAINNAYGARPARLTAIDGGYATLSCALIGVVLTVF